MDYTLLMVVATTVVTMTLCKDIIYNTVEERPRGTFIGDVSVDSKLSDRYSRQEFSQLKYSFLLQGYPYTKFFMIQEKGGQIYTATKLNRERICNFRILTCIVHLSVAVQSLSADDLDIIKIQVVIGDKNDNPPRFPTPEITLDIPESVLAGEEFVISGAIDNDAGHNSVAMYTMEYNSYFKINTIENLQGGLDVGLVVKQQLDREELSHHTLIVRAVDNGKPKLTGSLTINIIVTDVNDHKPVFSARKYNVSLVESASLGRTVITLKAVDRDTGKNGEIKYTFGSQTPLNVKQTFSIDTKSGDVILQRTLDYETQPIYNFDIVASDSGPQPRSSSTIVTVNIIDVNDEIPKISFSLLAGDGFAILSESAPVGKFAAHMSVEDRDSGANGDVACYLDTSKFRLKQMNDKNYKILLNERLDRETKAEYNIKVTCQDGGFPSLRGSKMLRISVKDSNDNKPIFSKSLYRASIFENPKLGTFVLQVSATDVDVDKNGQVRYELHGRDKRYFGINEKSGKITVAEPIDREKLPEAQMFVVAKDFGMPTQFGQATVIIDIKDISDDVPAFQYVHYKFMVREHRPANVTIGSVFAMDLDQGSAGEVRYSIDKSSNRDGLFTIGEKDGTIFVNRELDREITSEYSIVVVATDLAEKPLSSSVEVVVVVTDINDNAPNISFPISPHNNTFTILHTLPINSVILEIDATDADDGINGLLVYHVKHGNQFGLFRVDQTSGEVTVARRMSVDDCATYNLLVVVKDSASQAKYAETRFRIIVLQDKSNKAGILTANKDGHLDAKTHDNAKKDGFNIVIIIIIIVATVIASCLIIVAIICVRRRDRSRDMGPKTDEEDGIVKTCDKFAVPPANLDNLDNISDKCKKEVSFSLEDIQNSQNNSFSTFKGQTGINNKPYIDCPNGSYIALTRTKPHSNHDRYIDNNSSGGTKIQNYVAPEPQWTHAHPLHSEMNYLVDFYPHDDERSDLSGEATLSDSGRGGSEESFSHPSLQPPNQIPVVSPRSREGVSYMSFEGVDCYEPFDLDPNQKHVSTLPRDYRTDVHCGSHPGLHGDLDYACSTSPSSVRRKPRRDIQNATKFNAPLGTTALIETMMIANNRRDNELVAKKNNLNLREQQRNNDCLNPDEKYGVEETGYGTVAESTDCYSLSDGESLHPIDEQTTCESQSRDRQMHDLSFVTSEDGTAQDDDETMTTTSGSYNVSADEINFTSDQPYKLKDVFV